MTYSIEELQLMPTLKTGLNNWQMKVESAKNRVFVRGNAVAVETFKDGWWLKSVEVDSPKSITVTD